MFENGFRDYISGYIIVRVEGLNPEKFINMCSRNGIRLWDINKTSYTVIEFKMKHYQYKKLKTIINKTGCRAKIIKKHGVDFVLGKLRRRKFFVAGIAAFCIIILYLSNLVWIIKIDGNKKVNTQLIYDAVRTAGLAEGKPKYKINLRDIESSVLKQVNEISIVNIKFKGTRAEVEIVERTMPPQIISTDTPVNLIADKDGIILKMFVYRGQPLVNAGDMVKKGQVLISGIITDSTNVPSKLVHAMGDITAKTWYEAVEEVNLDYKYEERTGRTKKKIYYNIMGKKICVKNDNIDFVKYDKIEEKNMLKLIGYETPIEQINEYYYEKIEKEKKLSYNEALEIAVKKGEDKLKASMPQNVKIIDKKLEKELGNGKAKIRLLYVAEENIGINEAIK